MPLPTDVAPGDPGHATLHNDVNEAVNALDVEADYTNAFAPIAALARRGNWVEARLTAAGPDSPYPAAVPMGFRPTADLVLTGVDPDDNLVAGRVSAANGDLIVIGSSSECTLHAVWFTADPAPA
jgi:hypothetical protein